VTNLLWPKLKPFLCLGLFSLVALPALFGCSKATQAERNVTNEIQQGSVESGVLTLPEIVPADLGNSGKLQVVATTSIIGDIVSQVGGEAILLTVLMDPGQDPHSYDPSARDLTAVSTAHIIYVNGWNLEISLIDDLINVGRNAPLLPVSAGIAPLLLADGGTDPHIWLDPHHVVTWIDNIKRSLSELDPAKSALYEHNAETYLTDLAELVTYYDERISSIVLSNRKLVTNHDSLGHFADRYGFEIIGSVIPAADTLAEPSSGELSGLIALMRSENVCAIYVETTANDQLAQAAAAELDNCESVQVLTLHTGAVGSPGSGADSYIGMMRANLETIVLGQQHE
jgi:ABC-type Zn uptake system ZnuABC Zn-binding protein ZnuA